MSIVIVGADKLGNIPKNLKEIGYTDIKHITGRHCKKYAINIPKDTDAVLVLTDFINHNLTSHVKGSLKGSNVKVYYSKRSWNSIEKMLLN